MKRCCLNPLKTLLTIGLIFISIHNFGIAQDKAAEIDKMMRLYHEYGQFNGTVLVAEDGQVIFKQGYGLANMEWNISNQPNTKFRLGSITKQFTSMLVMQLVEEGKIRLNGKVTDYIPEYRKDTGERVSVHHLLSHTSGIPDYTSLPGFFRDVSRDPYTVDEFVRKYCSGNLEFEPGSRYAYSNSGYFVLGAIIEKVTGKTYEENLKERILDPAGMKDTGYDHSEPVILNRASGYNKTFNGYENAAYLDMSIPYSAGSLYSTVEDLYLWDQVLYTNKLLSKKTRDIMFTPNFNNYAYGWGVRKMSLGGSRDSVKIISHAGGINGFHTLIRRIVDDKHLIVLLNNTGDSGDLYRMCTGIINILYDMPYDPPKKSVAETLYKTLAEKDIASVIAYYHELQQNYPDDYEFRESELNTLGYQLLAAGKSDEAVEIFKLNTELHPESSNVYDSLGEAYMKKGQKDLAIKSYAKSLELNPRNTNAVMMLSKITETE